jgi:ketosteroid isomerase-like protein
MTTLEQITDKEQELLQAMLRSDVEKLDNLISDDLIFTDHNGQILNKLADIETHRSGKLKMESIKPSEQIIKIYQDTAIVSVLLDIKGKYMGQPFHGKDRYSRIWILMDNSWKIVAVHSSVMLSMNSPRDCPARRPNAQSRGE